MQLSRYADRAMIFIALLFLFSLVLNYGFYLPLRYRAFLDVFGLILIPFFLLYLILKGVLSRDKRAFLRTNILNIAFAAFFIIHLFLLHRILPIPSIRETLLNFKPTDITKAYIILAQIYMLSSIALRTPKLVKLLFGTRMRPPEILVFSFLLIVLTGTILLLLPRATSSGRSLDFLSALFTATSATCVTGLIVVPTGPHFSLFGHVVILILIQIGGLGLMTFATFFAMAAGGGLGIRESVYMKDILNYEAMAKIGTIVRSILLITFTCELCGAVLFFLKTRSEFSSVTQAAFHSLFHSVSAFCNAGFCLYTTSFMDYRTDIGINAILSILIIMGGLGFVVNANLLQTVLPGKKKKPLSLRYSLQTKLILIVTVILLAVGTIGIFAGEYDNFEHGIPFGGRVLTSFFQSMTARTAGFNTLDIGQMKNATLFLIVILMFIGASPGSTGGGIKTSTFAILLLSLVSVIRQRNHIEVFHRTITQDVINKALGVIVSSFALVIVSTLIVSFVEPFSFISVLFEVVSAFGTVGLSTGITPFLSSTGKIVIICTMFIGRIGPLTLFLLMGSQIHRQHYYYPRERIMIG
jgi:trk system potassium uptake protein TrkH